MKKTLIAASAAALILGGGGIAYATGTAPFSEPAPQPLATSVEGLFKPSQELTVLADCPSASAELTTSFGASTTMSPAADRGALVGYVTAPVNIGPGPDDGYHTYTVTCSSGETVTARIPSGGNGS